MSELFFIYCVFSCCLNWMCHCFPEFDYRKVNWGLLFWKEQAELSLSFRLSRLQVPMYIVPGGGGAHICPKDESNGGTKSVCLRAATRCCLWHIRRYRQNNNGLRGAGCPFEGRKRPPSRSVGHYPQSQVTTDWRWVHPNNSHSMWTQWSSFTPLAINNSNLCSLCLRNR